MKYKKHLLYIKGPGSCTGYSDKSFAQEYLQYAVHFLKITDVKDFMNKLLIGEVFDRFSLVEASVTTFNTFTINGKLHYDFFDTDTKVCVCC